MDQRYTFHQTIADYARLHLDSLQPQEGLIEYALAFVEAHQIDYELLDQEYSTILVALEATHALNKQAELICLQHPIDVQGFAVSRNNAPLDSSSLLCYIVYINFPCSLLSISETDFSSR